jgi:hypothetical protein
MMGKLTKPPNDIPDTSSNQTTCALYFLSAGPCYEGVFDISLEFTHVPLGRLLVYHQDAQ